MNDDPVLAAVQRFMDAVETRVGTLTNETRALLTEARSALSELQTRSVPSGPPGQQGERGEPGPAGKDGRDGIDGKDGVAGPPGERGADGIMGPPGERGERGADGVMGPPGERGERGADGLNGRDGAPGERGERGERGADGIASVAELDARFAAIEAGARALIEERFAELQVRTIADSYQGVFKPGATYARGLLATWDGSLWLATDETSAKPGEKDSGWKMIVKRGADGRR